MPSCSASLQICTVKSVGSNGETHAIHHFTHFNKQFTGRTGWIEDRLTVWHFSILQRSYLMPQENAGLKPIVCHRWNMKSQILLKLCHFLIFTFECKWGHKFVPLGEVLSTPASKYTTQYSAVHYGPVIMKPMSNWSKTLNGIMRMPSQSADQSKTAVVKCHSKIWYTFWTHCWIVNVSITCAKCLRLGAKEPNRICQFLRFGQKDKAKIKQKQWH